jgi:hypothetical protein
VGGASEDGCHVDITTLVFDACQHDYASLTQIVTLILCLIHRAAVYRATRSCFASLGGVSPPRLSPRPATRTRLHASPQCGMHAQYHSYVRSNAASPSQLPGYVTSFNGWTKGGLVSAIVAGATSYLRYDDLFTILSDDWSIDSPSVDTLVLFGVSGRRVGVRLWVGGVGLRILGQWWECAFQFSGRRDRPRPNHPRLCAVYLSH